MIRLEAITRRYGAVLAVDDVSLAVAPGEVVGLLGANGAGKSTLLRIATGLQTPDRGRVEIAGVDLARDPVEAKRRLGYMAEEPSFYDELSAAEYLAFVAAVRGLDPAAARAQAAALGERLGLGGRMDEPVDRFSHGMRKKLSFAAAVLHRPAVVLCDEALEGFDVAAAIAALADLRALADGGAAVLFSSHVTATLERLCDPGCVPHGGQCARVLPRAHWGPAGFAPSPLEREFLAVAASPPNHGQEST